MGNSRHVLLIGGPPGAGKTTLGRAVAAQLAWPALTVDDLAVAVNAMIGPADNPALHPTAEQGYVRYFTEGPPQKLISDAMVLENELWPAVERVINVHATIKESIVVDWWLLSAQRVAGLGVANVSSVWLHIDGGALLQREQTNVEFLQDSPDPEAMLSNFMARSLWRNELVRSEAQRQGLPVIHQPGDRPTGDLVREVLDVTGLGSLVGS